MRDTIKIIHFTETNFIGKTPNLKKHYDTNNIALVCLSGEKRQQFYSFSEKRVENLFWCGIMKESYQDSFHQVKELEMS